MKDYFGNELGVGDKVAFTEPQYRNLIDGEVVKFTPQKVRVRYMTSAGYITTYLSLPNFLIKAPE